jgi:hypothetical protein
MKRETYLCHRLHVAMPTLCVFVCAGGHNSNPIFKNIRDFLRFEWERHALARGQGGGDTLPTFQPGRQREGM